MAVPRSASRRHPQMAEAIQEWRPEADAAALTTLPCLVPRPEPEPSGADQDETEVGEKPPQHPEPHSDAGECDQEPLHQLDALTEGSTLSALNETP